MKIEVLWQAMIETDPMVCQAGIDLTNHGITSEKRILAIGQQWERSWGSELADGNAPPEKEASARPR